MKLLCLEFDFVEEAVTALNESRSSGDIINIAVTETNTLVFLRVSEQRAKVLEAQYRSIHDMPEDPLSQSRIVTSDMEQPLPPITGGAQSAMQELDHPDFKLPQ